jgi:predicted nucleic acid-binding protein
MFFMHTVMVENISSNGYTSFSERMVIIIKIYMDNCCLNRPFDDLSDDAVRLEAEAVVTIIDNCESGIWDMCGSDVLHDEIDRISNSVRKQQVQMLYDSSNSFIEFSHKIIMRGKELERFGIKSYDALHIASAEEGGVDVLLTTDRKLIKAAARSDAKVTVKTL